MINALFNNRVIKWNHTAILEILRILKYLKITSNFTLHTLYTFWSIAHLLKQYTHLFISNIYKTLISNARLIMAKIKIILGNTLRLNFCYLKYSHSLSTISSNTNRTYSETKQTNKCVCIHTINHNKNEDENKKQISKILHKKI